MFLALGKSRKGEMNARANYARAPSLPPGSSLSVVLDVVVLVGWHDPLDFEILIIVWWLRYPGGSLSCVRAGDACRRTRRGRRCLLGRAGVASSWGAPSVVEMVEVETVIACGDERGVDVHYVILSSLSRSTSR